MYDIVNEYYGLGFYDAEMVKIFVEAGYITSAEYKKITGKTYKA